MGHESKGEELGSVTYSTDREVEVSKIFIIIISTVYLMCSGTFSIDVGQLQISYPPWKQNKSI